MRAEEGEPGNEANCKLSSRARANSATTGLNCDANFLSLVARECLAFMYAKCPASLMRIFADALANANARHSPCPARRSGELTRVRNGSAYVTFR